MPASFPTSVKAFTTKNTNDTIQASHVDDVQDEVTAIETLLLGGTTGHVLTAGSPPSYQSASGRPVEETTAVTGAQNDYDLDSPFTYLRCTGAAPVFTGFTVAGSAPTAGDRVILDCLGTTLKVSDQTGSVAANQIICEATQGQIVGANGRLLCVYDGTVDRWRATVLSPGDWIDVTHAAGNFTGNGAMTWTVEAADQLNFKYQQRGKSLTVILQLAATAVGGTPNSTLQVTLPFTVAMTSSTAIGFPAIGQDNSSVLELLQVFLTNASAVAGFLRTGGGNWSASVNATSLAAVLVCEIT
jgi:hypothetical protein